MNMSVVDFACEIIEMNRTIEDQRFEINRLREIEKKYDALLNSTLAYSAEMSGQVLELVLNKGEFDPKRLLAEWRLETL